MSINRPDQIPDSTLQSLYRSAVVDAIYRDLMADLCLRAAPVIRAAAEKAAVDLEATIRQRFDIEADRFLMKLEIKLPPTTDKED